MRIDEMREILSLGDHEKEIAAEAWTLIESEMPRIVPEFYQYLREKEQYDFFDKTDIKLLQKKQMDYWKRLFRFGFNDAYFEYVGKIWNVHRKFGVSMELYIAAYAWYSERFFQIMARSDPRPPLTRYQLLSVTNRVIYIDLMIASSHDNNNWEVD